jgi:pimeloyl-ACP methyl ester carboxylesterase
MRRVDLPEITLSVTDVGEGPAVVLLHGFPDRAAMWSAQIDALVAAGHRVIAPDLRGFGESDRPDDVAEYRVGRSVADVLALLDVLGVEEAAVAGHDFGAAVGWALAMTTPRVTRYAALSVGHPGAGRDVAQLARSWYMLWFLFPGVAEQALPADDWAFFRHWAHPDAGPGDELVARQIADLERPGALTAGLNWYRANIAPAAFVRPRRELPPVSCPVLGVWSTDDIALGEEQMTASADHVSGSWRYERLTGVGHWMPVRAAGEVSTLLADFTRPAR